MAKFCGKCGKPLLNGMNCPCTMTTEGEALIQQDNSIKKQDESISEGDDNLQNLSSDKPKKFCGKCGASLSDGQGCSCSRTDTPADPVDTQMFHGNEFTDRKNGTGSVSQLQEPPKRTHMFCSKCGKPLTEGCLCETQVDHGQQSLVEYPLNIYMSKIGLVFKEFFQKPSEVLISTSKNKEWSVGIFFILLAVLLINLRSAAQYIHYTTTMGVDGFFIGLFRDLFSFAAFIGALCLYINLIQKSNEDGKEIFEKATAGFGIAAIPFVLLNALGILIALANISIIMDVATRFAQVISYILTALLVREVFNVEKLDRVILITALSWATYVFAYRIFALML